jgi:phage baseplate assembly protein W
MVQIDYPYGFDGTGRTATTGDSEHIRDLIEQVLFTSPGERVNRPDFGSGLLQLVFEPNSDALATATRMGVEGALQRWLGELVLVEAVQVRNIEGRLDISIQYVERRSQERRVERFSRTGAT